MRAPSHIARKLGARLKSEANPAFDQRPDADRVVLRLPVPISVNAMHSSRKGGGIRRSDAYVAWIKEAGWRLEQQKPGRIPGRYALDLGIPRECGIDLDNTIKVNSDLLQLHGVIRNDRDAERITLWWHDQGPEAILFVWLLSGPLSLPMAVDALGSGAVR